MFSSRDAGWHCEGDTDGDDVCVGEWIGLCRIACERDGKGIEKGILEEEVEEVQLLQATAMIGGRKG